MDEIEIEIDAPGVQKKPGSENRKSLFIRRWPIAANRAWQWLSAAYKLERGCDFPFLLETAQQKKNSRFRRDPVEHSLTVAKITDVNRRAVIYHADAKVEAALCRPLVN